MALKTLFKFNKRQHKVLILGGNEGNLTILGLPNFVSALCEDLVHPYECVK